MKLVNEVRRLIARAGHAPDDCGVKRCDKENAEIVELLAFDPIDHDSTVIQLCPKHREWADERNAFAEQIHEELREARKMVGVDHIETIQELTLPDETMGTATLMGEEPQSLDDKLEDPK